MLTKTNKNELYCFISEDNEQIVGAIILTKITFENNVNAFILSPVAVSTKHQGKGIGQKLINFGIKALKSDDVKPLISDDIPSIKGGSYCVEALNKAEYW